MANPYVGEIRCFGFNVVPRGWAPCDGRLLPILSNEMLFSILGTTYGGGIGTFALPDLRGRAPMHFADSAIPPADSPVPPLAPGLTSTIQGKAQGAPTVPLDTTMLPPHSHDLRTSFNRAGDASTRSAAPDPSGLSFLAASGIPNQVWADATTNPSINAPFAANAISSTGGSPHDNMQPYLALNFCIALDGAFPLH